MFLFKIIKHWNKYLKSIIFYIGFNMHAKDCVDKFINLDFFNLEMKKVICKFFLQKLSYVCSYSSVF